MMTKFSSIDEYIAAQDNDKKACAATIQENN